MDPVVHFEIPYNDAKRMADFYSSAFGWQMNALGQKMGNYVLATTVAVDETTQRPKDPGAINGGFFNRSDSPNPTTSIVISVDDLEASMEKVKKAGGTLIGEPMEIPGIGMFIGFSDTEGNQVGMLQPAPMDGQS